jgi:glycosyltransferase involved in cell wall biosynthesis
MLTSVIIPALNEAESIAAVLSAIPIQAVHEVIVVDGGSSDSTVETARMQGATVIFENRKGYGWACHTGSEHAAGEILVFLDADGANDPAQIPILIEPVESDGVDMVLGSRLAGNVSGDAMPWYQHFGNWLSAGLIRGLYGFHLTDLSPFRAVNRDKLATLDIHDQTYGWPTEVLVKAIRQGWNIREVPVEAHPRIAGNSKISGTLRGTYLATVHILMVILRYAL